ncbi:MAG TPA: glycosyltransferase [Gemmatimonadaceae bacterium]|jgi:spore maturation protein CgeB
MKLVIFGLTISSSWGNGHATLWRGLLRAFAKRGHDVVFFERDVPYYATHRDLRELEHGRLRLYADWADVRDEAKRELEDADAGMVTSYCPDGIGASELVLDSNVARRVFYDLDTPVTLSQLSAGERVPYLPPQGLGDFDLVLSYTGGEALTELRSRLHARLAAPLYGSVDPNEHRPVAPVSEYRSDLSYLGTYAEDRQHALTELFLEPARRLPSMRFLIGGAQYPSSFPWSENIHFKRHLPPAEHPAFFSSSRMTLNVTRGAMATMGWCPSGRLFEAAACGVPILSDSWAGLDQFFTPGSEIFVAENSDDAVGAIALDDATLRSVAAAARERALTEHTAERRAAELESMLASFAAETVER